MYSKGKIWLAAGSLVAATALVIPPSVLAAVADKVQSKQTIERGKNGTQSGYWIHVEDTTLRWYEVSDKIKEIYMKVFNSVPITDAQLKALTDKVSSGKLTLAGLETQLRDFNAVLKDSAYDNKYSTSSQRLELSNARKELEATFKIGYKNDLQGPNESSTLRQAHRFLVIAEALESGLYDFPTSGASIIGEHSLNLSSSYYAYFTEYRKDVQALGTHSGNYSGGSRNRFEVKNVTAAKAREIALDLYQLANKTASPIALDLNHDGKIGVTGKSSAKVRNYKNAFVRDGSVLFDLEGKGKVQRYEWMNGDGDGFLVDDRDGKVSQAAKGNGVISGHQLFGNAGGYAHGFAKLAMNFDSDIKLATNMSKLPPGYGKITGKELEGLKVWIDTNRDAKVQLSELKTLPELGITEIGSSFDMVKNPDGELLMQSHYFVQHGKKHLTEDVWFAVDPADGQ